MLNIEDKQGYKYTEEFGYIPEGWEVKNIIKTSNLKARIGWQGLTTAEYLNNGDYLLITGTDFDNGKINWQSCFYVEKKRYDQDTNIQLKNGDVLITKDGTIGKVAYIDKLPKPTTLNSGVFVVRPLNEAYNTKYFYYLLQSNIFISFLNKLKAGSTIVHLYQKDLSNFDYIIPSDIQEQEKIAEVLGDVDSLIDKTQQLIDKKKALKTAAMQKLLTPKDNWEVVSLSKYAYVFIGLVTTMTTNYVKNGVPLIRNSDIKTNKIIRENLIQLDSKFAEEYNNRKLKIGDIVTVHTGDVGTSAIIDKTLEGAIGFATLNTRVDKNKLLPQFLCWYFNSEKFLTECLLASTGDGRQNLNLYDFIEFNIPVPPIEEQKQISDILDAIHVEIENLEKELNKYKDLKTGMMQQLLTGKVRLI